MAKPISIQLYTLREQMKDGNHLAVLETLGKTGFSAVEPAGFHGMSAADYRKAIEDNGMTISSNHGPMPNAGNKQEVADMYGALGCTLAGSGFGPDQFKTVDEIKASAEKINEAIAVAEELGLTFMYHNHWWEFQPVDGKLGIDHLLEFAPKMQMQIDTYWAAAFGANDPAAMVAKYKDRAPSLHIKDGPLVQGEPHVAAGSGKMDLKACVEAADPSVLGYGVMELDHCATDMTTAVIEGYKYLTSNGILSGRV